MKKVVVLVGKIGSGKSLIANYLVEKHGFSYYSLSETIRWYLRSKGITEFTRAELQDAADGIRKGRNDAGALVEMTIERAKSFGGDKILFDSVKNPGEVDRIRERFEDVLVIGVDANRKLRFERTLSRGKATDPKTWEEFIKRDDRDNGDDVIDPFTLSNSNALKKADVIIMNEGEASTVLWQAEQLLV